MMHDCYHLHLNAGELSIIIIAMLMMDDANVWDGDTVEARKCFDNLKEKLKPYLKNYQMTDAAE